MEVTMKCKECNTVNFAIPYAERETRKCKNCGGPLKEFTVDLKENGASVIPPEPVFIDILRTVIKKDCVSMSMIQRLCSVGYNGAGRAIDWMEANGYISKFETGVPRKVLIDKAQFEELYGPFEIERAIPQPVETKPQEPLDVKEELMPMYVEALRQAVKNGVASISFIQRRCGYGYNLSGKIFDWMEANDYVAAFDGGKFRKVLLTKEQFEEKYGALDGK